MKMKYLALLAPLLLAAATPADAALSPADLAAIRQLETAQEAAWNAHDAHAYAQLFAADADTVNVLGWWWKSRAELEKQLGDAFAFVFAHSKLHIDDVAIRPLGDDIAVVHVTWSMTGAIKPTASAGAAPELGIQTQVVRRTGSTWLIEAFHNTNSLPVRPFPKGNGFPPT